MNIRVLFILLLCAVVVVIHGKYRRTGLGLSVVLLGAIAWLGIQTPHQSAPPVSSSSAAPEQKTFPIANIELSNFDLQGSGAPWRVVGQVRNLDTSLSAKSVVLAIQRLDCTDVKVADEDCVLNWQGEITLDTSLPAGKAADIEQELWSHSAVPRIKGVTRLHFTIQRVVSAG